MIFYKNSVELVTARKIARKQMSSLFIYANVSDYRVGVIPIDY